MSPANPFSEGLSVKLRSDTADFTSGIDNAIGQLGSLSVAVGAAGAALGALAVGGLAKAASAAASYQDSLIEVEKVTNPETAREMGLAIRDMAESIPLAQSALADIAADAGRFGITGPKNIRSFTEAVSKMSVATDLSAEQAGESLAKLAQLTGTPIERVEDLGSVINELSNNFATSSQEIVDSMLRSSAALSQLGLSQTEITGLSAALNAVSESSERAGSRMRRLAQEMMDPSKVADLAASLDMDVEAFKRMRKEAPLEVMRMMVKRFKEGGESADLLRTTLSTTSQQAIAGLAQNTEGMNRALEMANSEFEKGTSLQKEFDTATSTFNSRLTILSNKMRNLAISIGQNLLPPLTTLLNAIIRGVDAFGKLNSKTSGLLGTVTLVTAAVGGFAVAASAALSAIGGMSALVGGIATAFTLLNPPVLAAAAVIATLAFIWKKNLFDIQGKTKAVINFLRSIIQSGMEFISGIWGIHSDALGSETTETFAHIQSVFNDFVAWVRPFVADALAALSSFWDSHGDTISQIIDIAFSYIRVVIGTTLDAVLTIVRSVLALIRGDFNDFTTIVTGFIERLVNRIVGLFEKLKRLLVGGSIVPEMLSSILSAIKSWSIVDVFGDVLGSVQQTVGNIVDGIIDTVRGALDTVGTIGDRVSSTVSDIQGAVDSAQDAAASVADTAGDVVGGAVDAATGGGGGSDNTLPGVNFGLPSFQSGGLVGRSGLAMVHEGERVVPASKAAEAGTTVHIDRIVASGPEEGQAAARALKQELRSSNF